MFPSKILKTVLAGGACALAIATAAHAQVRSFNIPPGDLRAALDAYGAQSGVQLIYRSDELRGLKTQGLRGAIDQGQALASLLANTGLSTQRQPSGAIAILKAPPDPRDAAAPAAPEPAQLSELTVTGSHIRGAQVASPVLTLTRGDIEKSGRMTLTEALQALPQNFGGAAAEGNESTGADHVGRNSTFATGLNLRGLGNNATLVLVNGRRVGGSGAFGDFVDISTIPTAAVERVEVLLDGASALYGSDAVGGVVNIILRKDYEGAETRVAGGIATDGGTPDQAQLSQTFGHRWGSGGLLVTLEADQRTALNGAERPFAASADLRGLGGVDHRVFYSFPGNIMLQNPATGVTAPAYAIPAGQGGVGLTAGQLLPGVVNLHNQREGYDLLPRQTAASVYVAGDQELSDVLDVTADARYGVRHFALQQAVPISLLTVTRANPYFVSPTGASSESLAYAFADLPNPYQYGFAETLSSTLGATLKLGGDWRLEGYAAFGQELDIERTHGNLNSTDLNEALGTIPDQPGTSFSTAQDGFYNPFAGVVGANSPAVLAFIGSGSTYNRTLDRVYTANLQADGSLWSLPAGAVKLAVGAQVRRETFVRGGYNFVSGAAPTPQSSADAARDVAAAYGELRIPVFGPDAGAPGFERLELSLAGRVEHYQSIGSTADPQLGVLWQPVSGLNLRATYGTSFRAPALRELDDPASYDPGLFSLGGTQVRGLELLGGNPDLKPETARSWTFGFDYRPSYVPDLALGLTWFDIRYSNRIAQPVLQDLAGALTDPTLTAFVKRIAPATNATDLATITALINSPAFVSLVGVFPATDYGAIVDARYVNTAALEVRGLDLNAQYGFDLAAGRVALATNASYMFDYDQQLTPTSPVVNEVGIVGYPVRFQSRTTADWTRGRFTAGIALNYTGRYKAPTGARIDDNATVDLRFALAPAESGPLKGLRIALNVRNLFDQAPPFYDNPVGVGYDPATGDPIGRFVFLELARAW